MIEKLLIDAGFGCGTVKNFNAVILDAQRTNDSQRWYFLTPLKVKDNGSGYKEVSINFAFPIVAELDDIDEKTVLSRLANYESECRNDLLKFLRKYFKGAPISILAKDHAVISFWSTNAVERLKLTDFANNRIHLLNLTVTLKYRETWFKCNCN